VNVILSEANYLCVTTSENARSLQTFCFATKRLKKRKNPNADSVTIVPLCGDNCVVAAAPPDLACIREEILRRAAREKFNSVGGGENIAISSKSSLKQRIRQKVSRKIVKVFFFVSSRNSRASLVFIAAATEKKFYAAREMKRRRMGEPP
jgi:hypothetical protein